MTELKTPVRDLAAPSDTEPHFTPSTDEFFATLYPDHQTTDAAQLKERKLRWDTTVHFLRTVFDSFQKLKLEHPDQLIEGLTRIKFVLMLKLFNSGWEEQFTTAFRGKDISRANLEIFIEEEKKRLLMNSTSWKRFRNLLDTIGLTDENITTFFTGENTGEKSAAATQTFSLNGLNEEQRGHYLMIEAMIELLQSQDVTSFESFLMQLPKAASPDTSQSDLFSDIDLWFSPQEDDESGYVVTYESASLPTGDRVYDIHVSVQAVASPRSRLARLLTDLQRRRSDKNLQRAFQGANVRGISWLLAESRPQLLRYLQIPESEIALVSQIDATQVLKNPEAEQSRFYELATWQEIIGVSLRNIIVSDSCTSLFIAKGKLPSVGVVIIPHNVFFRPAIQAKYRKETSVNSSDSSSVPPIWRRVVGGAVRFIRGF